MPTKRELETAFVRRNEDDENDTKNLLPKGVDITRRHSEIAAIADDDDEEDEDDGEKEEDANLPVTSMTQVSPIRMNCTTDKSESVRSRHRITVIARSLCCILVYYAFSIGLTFYNRRLFIKYNYPLAITLAHMCIKLALAILIRCVLTLCYKHKRVLLDCNTYLTRLLPTSLASSIDIAFSNWSLEYITISLYTMTKSTAILFILLFSILFKLEKWRPSIIAIVGCIAFGLFLFTYDLTEFNPFGFVLAITASFASGLRWTLAQSITQKHELGLSNPVDMIYHVQPGMILFLLPLAIYIEGWPTYMSGKQAETFHELMDNFIWVILGSFLAFLLESSEYLVVTYTSSLTLSVAGIFKEICTLYLAIVWAQNKLNTLNAVGLVVCLTGISFHIYYKAKNADESSDEMPHSIRRRATKHINGNCNESDNSEKAESKFFNFKFKSNKQSAENIPLDSHRQPLLNSH